MSGTSDNGSENVWIRLKMSKLVKMSGFPVFSDLQIKNKFKKSDEINKIIFIIIM